MSLISRLRRRWLLIRAERARGEASRQRVFAQLRTIRDNERKAFLKAAESQKREVKALCQVLYYTGCRISEALELTPKRIDHSEQTRQHC